MNSKKIMVLLLLLSTSIFYGQRKGHKDKIKALKVAYITERLDLSSKEAEAFWPIYNAHQKELDNLREEERTQIYGVLRDVSNLPDKEVDALLRKHIQLQERKHKAEKSLLTKLDNVLSSKKIFLLLRTENGFKRRLLKEYRKNKGRHP